MSAETITLELERAALHAVLHAWRTFNEDYFRGALSLPIFGLTSSGLRLGCWVARRRTIEIDRALILGHPWTTVLEVLKHEMAHQYVDEVLHRHDETAHGAAFRQVCADRGIDARAHGLPESSEETTDPRHKIIERVAKLLALAASANEHEAHVAMNTAQRLMLEHNIARVAEAEARRYVSRELGEPVSRLEQARSLIGVVLTKHFFVEVIQLRVWRVREGAYGSVLEVSGTPENVAMAEYVYAFLDRTADALWVQHKAAHGVKGDRGRRAFRGGVVLGFLAKLEEERARHAERGLVWVGDGELRAHHRQRYPRIVTVGHSGSQDHEARRHGEAAGRTVVLTRPIESTGGGGGAPRRLGDGRR